MVRPPELAGIRNARCQYCIRTRSNLLVSGRDCRLVGAAGPQLSNSSLQARGPTRAVTYVSFLCEVTHVTSQLWATTTELVVKERTWVRNNGPQTARGQTRCSLMRILRREPPYIDTNV
jgi:hypothetical protein